VFKVTEILPTDIDLDWLESSLRFMASETATDVRSDFDTTTKTFRNRPKFRKRGLVTSRKVTISVTTSDVNYKRLTKGVKGGYKIPKDGPGLLVFPSGYDAKTWPNRLRLGDLEPTEGGSRGELVFVYTQITAKGFEGRHFDKVIAEKWRPEIKKRMQLAISVPFGGYLMNPVLKRRVQRYRRTGKIPFM